MIIVKDCLVSEDVIEKQFKCNISACKGACCIEGDTGAPLEEDEIPIIQSNLDLIMKEMDEAGLDSLNRHGVSELDPFDEHVTTCKSNGECTFAITEKGRLSCAIEKANQKHDFDFIKPISCHLYPIRVKQFNEYHALNYHKWDICSPACEAGKEHQIAVYEFAKPALTRKFGESWYQALESAVKEFLGSKS
ncbi:MAG: DUF3109 family protein [Bacteroidia bacterium]